MNLQNNLEWQRALESKSKPKIERKHLHHKDMTN